MKHGKIFSKGSLVLALSLTAVLLVTACTSGATATVVQVGNPQAPSSSRGNAHGLGYQVVTEDRIPSGADL
jgi:hypothetical protein